MSEVTIRLSEPAAFDLLNMMTMIEGELIHELTDMYHPAADMMAESEMQKESYILQRVIDHSNKEKELLADSILEDELDEEE